MISQKYQSLFDVPSYIHINEARWPIARSVISELREQGIEVDTAYDFGAGPGWFAEKMTGIDLDVVALEGRKEVAEVGAQRSKHCEFKIFDFDNAAMDDSFESRDFSLAFGILYHLENPLRALRMMARMTRKAMLLETMVVPGDLEIARVVRENPNDTQGIQPLAMILSPAAVERALWATGFQFVYRCTANVGHQDFHSNETIHERRRIWLLSREELNFSQFQKLNMEEPNRANYWQK